MALFTCFAACAALLAATAPVSLSFASVWLFAGPHNWMEARYFLSRLPSRWLHRKPFFLAALAGVALLGVAFAAAPPSPYWFTLAGLWILTLTRLAGRDAALAAGPVCLAIALAWFSLPLACLGLLYLHPLTALWFLFRQSGKRHPGQSPALCAAAITVFAAAVVTAQWNAPLPLTANLQALTDLPAAPHLLALHAYLELLHYGAWIVAIPALGLKGKPWQWHAIPLSRPYPRLISIVLAAGAVAVMILWAALAVDGATARRAYFTIAIFHVLAEAPMAIWLR